MLFLIGTIGTTDATGATEAAATAKVKQLVLLKKQAGFF